MIKSLTLDGFRNYKEKESFDFDASISILCGQNAQGKTNLIEAIYYVSRFRSFRTPHPKEMIEESADFARLSCVCEVENREVEIDVCMPRNGKTTIHVNGVLKRSHIEASGLLYTVLFSAEELELVRGSAASRRTFLDQSIAMLRPRYAKILQEYNKIYQHKSRILKDQNPAFLQLLDDYTIRMSRLGAQLFKYRKAYIEKLIPIAQRIHAEISGKETLICTYQTQTGQTDIAKMEESLFQHAMAHKGAELASGKILSGIHKDDMMLTIDGREARKFASQGQARTAALSLKMAEREIMMQDTGQTPILLLDDVLSELDEFRQNYILKNITSGQTIITCCAEEKIAQIVSGKTFFVEDGRILKEGKKNT